MAEVQTLEQQFEGISVQDENQDVGTKGGAPQHKSKVHLNTAILQNTAI